MARKVRLAAVPNKMKPKFNEITALTDPLCREYLNEEYGQLIREATAALCGRRPSPLMRGRFDIWACGIMWTVGLTNFLHDRSQNPHMSSADVCSAFGVRQSTGTNKAALVRKTLDMRQMDTNWCLPSRLESHPLAWLVEVNGLPVDVHNMPREAQEIAFEKGFVQFFPAETWV